MNILIVHAHENAKSFSSALRDKAVDYYSSRGDSVQVSDLYRMNFNPLASKEDFKSLSDSGYYKVQAEQAHAFSKGLFAEEIKTEMTKLEGADILIFNFPLWWFSLPAILKGWVDRVFAMGFAYGAGKGTYEKGVFPDKIACCTITTGGPEEAYREGSRNGDIKDILFHIHHGMFYFTGMQAKAPFVVYGPARIGEDGREAKLREYESYLEQLPQTASLF